MKFGGQPKESGAGGGGLGAELPGIQAGMFNLSRLMVSLINMLYPNSLRCRYSKVFNVRYCPVYLPT